MKLLVYPHEFFDKSFYSKDVILFPKYYDNNSFNLDLFILNSMKDDNLYKGTGNYWLFIIKYFTFLIQNRNKYKSIFFFHITLRNFPLILLTKLIVPSIQIILKSDLSTRNIIYFKNASFFVKLVLKFMLKFINHIYIETKWLYDELLLIDLFYRFRNKIIYQPNKIFNSKEEVEVLISGIKKPKTVLLYLRANDVETTNLKAFNKYIQIFLSPSSFFNDKTIHIIYDLNKNNKNIFFSSINQCKLDIVTHQRLDRIDFLRLISSSEYFILLSNEESFNFSIIEAIIAKCKILTTDVGVIKDLKLELNIPTFSKKRAVSSITESDFFLISIANEFIDKSIY